jgi:uncharacterized repeat protein (TIGR03803 family)
MTNLRVWKTACTIFLLLAATASPAQVFTTLVNFNGPDGAGSGPNGSLVQGADGNVYETTLVGGFKNDGAIIEVTPDGRVTTLHSFCRQRGCPDGFDPAVGLARAADGNFYGTTPLGGGSTRCSEGCGTVFKVDPRGTLTTLHSFRNDDGSYADGVLTEATDGNFYGTTSNGGDLKCIPPYGCGTVFKITPQGRLTTLHRFHASDGEFPNGKLVQATDGNFYGTTYAGGGTTYGEPGCRGNNEIGCGTIFRITPTGTLTTLHRFNNADGAYPSAGLVQASDGNLYGTTSSVSGSPCHVNLGCGTVFKMTLQGVLTTLYRFSIAEGSQPNGELIEATDGNFYGTTLYGGDLACNPPYDYGCGTVFQITTAGSVTILHVFDSTDGASPHGALLQATNGTIYGTTGYGGLDLYDGTLFSLNMGLGPFVSLVRNSGKVGHTGGILGQGFIGTTGVSLNEVPANFTVVSDTYLKATVPVGATTGYVTVTTPTGTLTSNVPFEVIP